MCSMPRLFLACVGGASALHATVVDERRVLLLGSSLDRNALLDFCDGHAERTDNPVQAVWCSNTELNARVGYIYHPGVGYNGDLHHPFALAKGLSTGAILKNHANKASLFMLNAIPDLVVVDSSLWDLFVWRLGTCGANQLPEPKPVTAERVQQWCQHDLPLLMRRVSEIFPASRIAFRTAPTIDHTPKWGKFEKQDIEMLYQCIRSSTENGESSSMLFGKYEIIDYYAIMKNLIDRNVPDLFLGDGYHPTWYPSALYFNEILRRVGLNPQDPPEPQANQTAIQTAGEPDPLTRGDPDREAKFEVAIQGDPNDLDLI